MRDHIIVCGDDALARRIIDVLNDAELTVVTLRSPADLAAGADAWLVDALDDPHLVVRRYAFQRLTELTNPTAVDRLRYRPDGRPDQRRDGVEWWRRQQQDGRLRGTPPAPP